MTTTESSKARPGDPVERLVGRLRAGTPRTHPVTQEWFGKRRKARIEQADALMREAADALERLQSEQQKAEKALLRAGYLQTECNCAVWMTKHMLSAHRCPSLPPNA